MRPESSENCAVCGLVTSSTHFDRPRGHVTAELLHTYTLRGDYLALQLKPAGTSYEIHVTLPTVS